MSIFDTWIKRTLPWTSTAYRNSKLSKIHVICRLEIALYRILYKNESIFQVIYYKDMWGLEIKSGGGSSLNQTVALRQALPDLVRRIGAHTVLDAGCGDYNWMKMVAPHISRYIGIEIVPELANQNCKEYESGKITFLNADIARDRLPQADLIICRDVLVHLSFGDINLVIKNFRSSNSRFLLTTTYRGISKNHNIFSGMWRPIDLQLPPFDFPPPIELINEEFDLQTDHPQKSLGLWDLRRLSGG